MLKKVLIANRGEIAVRVIRSCRELNITTVAVYSDADRAAKHVRYADEAYHIGPSPSKESYLDSDKIIATAIQCGADSIHPGYGFLSENAEFAKKCFESGLVFIGPDASAIHRMGDKITARATMMAAGVPVVPGTRDRVDSPESINRVLNEIGLPLIVKASAGGGGKGMRLVRKAEDLSKAVALASSEAKTAFGDETVYIEKYIESPHHIEFQIIADRHGNVAHLFERECSIQRRHQKMVEETPSPFITQELRDKMAAAAIAAARAVDYVGAGTIEFLVDAHRNFYFLEMNTRLQVEHPITEGVTGIDLVREQLLIASGQPLSFRQEEVRQYGHAIECRISAEDPSNNFMPSPGVIRHISEPNGLGVRTDGYVYNGFEIPMHYDPLITKLIAWGRTREEAIGRMKRGLSEFRITGIKTNIRFLLRILENAEFHSGIYDTHFIERHVATLLDAADHYHTQQADMAIIAVYLDYISKFENSGQNGLTPNRCTGDRWKDYGKKNERTTNIAQVWNST